MDKYFVIEDFGYCFDVLNEFDNEIDALEYCSNHDPFSRNPLIIAKAVKVIEQKR